MTGTVNGEPVDMQDCGSGPQVDLKSHQIQPSN